MAKGSTEAAVLGRGLRVRGRVRGKGDLRVEARVEGDVAVSGALELGDGAEVRGAVAAESVAVSGVLEGDIVARGEVVVSSTGMLRGDVEAASLVLEEGGQFHGRVTADFKLPDALA